MADGDNRQAGPLSIDEYLDMHEAPDEGQAEAEQDEPDQESEVEAETEEVEAEAETDEQDEPEAEDDEAPEVYAVDEYGDISISLPDGTQTTLKDLAQGNLRQADYSRKTAELSRERKELEAEREQLAARERQLNEQLANLEEPEPDWEKLAEEDPLGLPLKQIEWQKKQAQKAERKRKAEMESQQQREQFMRASAEVAVEKMPEWTDPKKFEESAAARKKAALDAGFTEQEFASVVDFRLAVLLEKAARYDAGQAKVQATQKKLSKVPKVVKPGTSVTKSEREAAERAARAKRRNRPLSVQEYLNTFDL